MNATLEKIAVALGMTVKFESMKLKNGVEIEAEVFEPEQSVFIVQDGERVALPVGEYELEDGRILAVAEEGVIAEIKEAPAEEPEAPVDEPEMSEEPEAPETPQAAPKKVVESISKETHFSDDQINSIVDKVVEKVLTKLASEEEVKEEVELSTDKIVHNPEEVEKDKEIKLYAQRGPQTYENRVFAKLFGNKK